MSSRRARFVWGSASWPVAVVAVAALALLVRLLLIAHSNGGSDLAIYNYFARLALHGGNPYTPPANGLFAPVYSNSPPVEVSIFAALLSVHESRTVLRDFFALSDTALILVVGFWFKRPRRWRLLFILFYAFNPFVLLAWTTYAEDKTVIFLMIALLVLALDRSDEVGAWLAATGLAVFKFLGAFAVPALAVHTYRRLGRRGLVLIGASIAAFALSNLPWFPASLDAFSRRNARLAINPPIHASPSLLLARIGLYAPVEAKLLPAIAAVVVLVLFLRRRLTIAEAVVWSIFVGYFFLPDDNFDRVLLITLPFLLILSLSSRQWGALWVVSSVCALAAYVATKGVPHWAAGISGTLRAVFAHEGTIRYVLWMNLLTGFVLGLYLYSKYQSRSRASRAPGQSRAPDRLVSR